MRLIDADALKESIKQQCDFCSSMGIKELSEIFRKALFQEVDNAPTIEERKTGKWESFLAYGKTVRHRCSECLAVAARDDFGNEYLSDYCSVCGSDMRGTSS